MAHNLDENDILEALEEPTLDSGSEGEIDEIAEDPEFPPSDSSDSSSDESGNVPSQPAQQESSSSAVPQGRKRQRVSAEALRRIQCNADTGWSDEDNLPIIPVFEEESGVTASIDAASSPFECFELFFPPSIAKHIKVETNRYASSVIAKIRREKRVVKNSLWNSWQPVKMHEFYLFFSIVIHMCLVKKSKLREYWSTNKFVSTPYPSSVMSRNRFAAILSNLHVNDNATYISRGNENHDPLHKIRPYFDHLVEIFASSYAPSENLTIDEGVCGFRGRVHFRVYMKNKPEKYGIKLFIVCDAASGYVLKMEVYCGKGNADNSIMPLFQRLLQNYFDKGHTVYSDRFYTSPALFDFLWERKTKAVGTCMSNRKGLPKQTVIKRKLKKGETAYMRRKHLLCLKWRDTRDVLLLSTKHKMTSSLVQVRTKEGLLMKNKPDAILDYNVNKVGVDRSDQMIAYYPFKRRQLKWWKKLFFHMFTMAITNAYVLYRATRSKEQKKNLHLSDFMLKIGEGLLVKGTTLAKETCSTTISSNRLLGRHFAEKIPATENKSQPTRTCKVCADRGKASTGKVSRRETIWWCSCCGVALCMPDCFKLYHTKANYISYVND
ncbi:piggyBac transposable element-derived protein 4-like [Ischnura elegans]|uniref:piggyBac transposable element-derived protein 4-like n=1 Tax=Ischnura elegans TaxID=197161 RepID=UPI001ED88723|nr:piggyBac transposable element-derived protein 4-like [Ischnura elegans]